MVNVSNIIATVFEPALLMTISIAAMYGLLVGAIPGLTALMAVALSVPFVIFMEPIPSIASIITISAMAIFAGDIPGALLRMPGTPASAAYTDDAFSLTKNGKAGLGLGAGLVASVAGGLISAVILSLAAPSLAEIALTFSSVEYFWLGTLGLSCAIFVSGSSLLKGLASLLLGLACATVGMDPVGGIPRFNFGQPWLLGGFGLIPMLIGFFAVSELLRGTDKDHTTGNREKSMGIGSILAPMPGLLFRHKLGVIRGGLLGTLVGALPGAGSDIAAWISYAIAKRSKSGSQDNEYGVEERIISASAANNASLGGAYIPATVFGIPGDAITAIVISVMFLKGVTPGPTLFLKNPDTIYAVFTIFFLANLLMIPFGILCIRAFSLIMRLPAAYISPIILICCILGAFAVENTYAAVVMIAVIGLLGYMMEANDIPLAPAILGLILGPLIEQYFVTSVLKSQGNPMIFLERPISTVLGIVTVLAWSFAVGFKIFRK
jgi:TctA family transporter